MFVQTYPEFNGLGISATPGVCYFCRTHRRAAESAILSAGVVIDHEGQIELCQGCVLEMAGHFGAIAPDKAQELRERNRAYGMQLKAAQGVIDAQEAQIEALKDQVEALRPVKK